MPDWTETELRLRIMRLLKYYNLDDYTLNEKKFLSAEDIEMEATANKARAFEERISGNTKIMIGGIYYNPPSNSGTAGDTFYQSFFSAKNTDGTTGAAQANEQAQAAMQ